MEMRTIILTHRKERGKIDKESLFLGCKLGRLSGLDHSQERIISEIKLVRLDTCGGYTNQERGLLTDTNAPAKEPQVIETACKT